MDSHLLLCHEGHQVIWKSTVVLNKLFFKSFLQMNKRVGAIEEFSVEALSEGTSLHCALVVSGWIDKDTVGQMITE